MKADVKRRPKISLKGALLGGIVAFVLSNVAFVPVALYMIRSHPEIYRLPGNQQSAAMQAAMHASPMAYASQLIIGFACSLFGGYVAARIAGREELINGAVSSWLCLIFAIYGFTKSSEYNSTLEVAGFIAAPAAGLLGGDIRSRRVANADQRQPGDSAPGPEDAPRAPDNIQA